MSFDPNINTYYIVTDVIFTAAYDLQPLVDALVTGGLGQVFSNKENEGRWTASGGILFPPHDVEPSIARFLDVLDALDVDQKRLWTDCISRDLDIGYQCGKRPFSVRNTISPELIQRVAFNQASISISLYAFNWKDKKKK